MGDVRSGTGPWQVFLCAAPLAVGLLLLQLFGPWAAPKGSLAGLTVPVSGFLPGLLTFTAVVTAHVFACLAAIMMALDLLRATPRSRPFARNGLILAVAVSAILVAALVLMPSNAGELTFGGFKAFFADVDAADRFTRPLGLRVAPLHLAIFIPTGLGVVAVAMVAAAANSQLSLFGHIIATRGARQAARIRQLHGRLKRCLYSLAVVLVTSTVAATLFFHLPARLSAAKDTQAAATLTSMGEFASEISLFWGLIYTLTLAVAVGLPILLLQNRLRRALEPPFTGPADSPRAQLASAGILSQGREQVKFLTALLAPLVAAPLTRVVESAALF
jgi:hypothetical protein